MVPETYVRHLQKELGKFGLTVSGGSALTFCCTNCGQQWRPIWRQTGRWQTGYRKCPKGCNEDLLKNGKQQRQVVERETPSS